VYNRNEYHGEAEHHRKAVFDITCTGDSGDRFIIEVQRLQQDYFRERALFYASRMIHDQAIKGRAWDYNTDAVYFIGILDFCLPDNERDICVRNIAMTDAATGKIFDKMMFIFVEIPRFDKAPQELKTDLDQWLYVLRDLHRLDKIPLILNHRIFKKLFHMAEVAKMSREEYMRYERSLMNYWDENGCKNFARKEGVAEGHEKGLAEGHDKGVAEGLSQAKQQIAKQMLASGRLTVAEIAEMTGLKEEFILQLA